jgi:hypothetical protein
MQEKRCLDKDDSKRKEKKTAATVQRSTLRSTEYGGCRAASPKGFFLCNLNLNKDDKAKS